MKRYSIEEIYPKSQVGKCMIYYNMSHHYRRVYSAKARVDTNLQKNSQPQVCCTSPAFYAIPNNSRKLSKMKTPHHSFCVKEAEEHTSFTPKILDYRADSKLKYLPIYQPPQRFLIKNANHLMQEEKLNYGDVEGRLDTCDENIEEPLKIIELRKGYNQQEKLECDANNHADGSGNEQIRMVNKSTAMFLKDITDDILKKGIYTNQSLDKLFFHHIKNNRYSLPQDVMDKEIARLKIELEVPLEDKKMTCSSLGDEEVLIALDSLLLPASVKDQVASALGLIKKPSPLPSPKDSFSGSLVLSTINERDRKTCESDYEMTGSLEKDDDHQEEKNVPSIDPNKNSTSIIEERNDSSEADEWINSEVEFGNSNKSSEANELSHSSEDAGEKGNNSPSQSDEIIRSSVLHTHSNNGSDSSGSESDDEISDMEAERSLEKSVEFSEKEDEQSSDLETVPSETEE